MRAAAQLEHRARQARARRRVDHPDPERAVRSVRAGTGPAFPAAPLLVADVAAIKAGGAAHGLRPLPGIRADVPPAQPLFIWFIWGHGTVLLMFIAAWLKPFPLYGCARARVRLLSKPAKTGRKRRIVRARAKKGGTHVPPFNILFAAVQFSPRPACGRRI